MFRQPKLFALRRTLAAALTSLAVAAPLAAGADEKPAAPVQPNVLFSAPLADMPGKQLVVLELRVPPKLASAPERPRTPHRHPGSVYIHVTEGTVRLGLEGEPVQTVSAGGSFFEPFGAVHVVTENVSATEPVRGVIVMIVPEGAPLTAPAARASAQSPQELAQAAGDGLLGAPAPALVLQTIDGDSLDLGALYGKKAVYLKFWATWCGPCMKQMPHFEHAYETAGPDVAVIGVNVGFNDSLPDVRAVIADKGLKMPTVIDDGRLAAAFNLRVTPQHVLIGRDGRVAYIGHLADERLDAELDALQASNGKRAAGAAPAAAVIEQFAVGDPLPDLTLATLDGRTFRARDAADRRPTVLVFISSWCESYFVNSRPELAASCRQGREQVAALAGRVDVRWLGVVSNLWERPAALRKYETDHAVGIPLALDESGEWFRAFDVMHTPTVVIADAGGKIVNRIDGFDPGLAGEIERVLGR